MDSRQFDALSRRLANGVSRRQAVTRLGSAGLLAGLTSALGRDRTAGARPAVQEGALSICHLEIVATIRLGPSAGVILDGNVPGELRGELSFVIGPDGAIDNGRLGLDGGAELPVVGQWDGRALNARVDIAADQTLILVGTGQQRFDQCTGDVDGLLTGPRVGDIGDWHATAELLGGAEGPPPTATTGAPGTSPTATATPTGAPTATAPASATATATPTVTQTPTPAPTATPPPTPTETPTPQPPTPTPEPPTPTPVVCPAGTTDCGGVCVDLLIDPSNCGACGIVCAVGQICSAGQCQYLQACISPQVVCGGVCVDLQTDPANCGVCGNACAILETCAGGECQPPEASQ